MITDTIYRNYVQILTEELIPAMGCTEPIALAYAGAKAREVLGKIPEQVAITVSGGTDIYVLNSQDNSVAERIDMIYQIVYMHPQNSKSYAEFGAMVSQERGLYHLEMVYTNKDKTSYMVYSAQHGDKREFLVMITTPTYRGCVIDIVGSLTLQDVMTMAEISGVPSIQ